MTSSYRTIQEWKFHILAFVWLRQIMYPFRCYDNTKSNEESFNTTPAKRHVQTLHMIVFHSNVIHSHNLKSNVTPFYRPQFNVQTCRRTNCLTTFTFVLSMYTAPIVTPSQIVDSIVSQYLHYIVLCVLPISFVMSLTIKLYISDNLLFEREISCSFLLCYVHYNNHQAEW